LPSPRGIVAAAAIVVLAAACADPARARETMAGAPSETHKLAVDCPFLKVRSHISNQTWLPLSVTVQSLVAAGAPPFRGRLVARRANGPETTAVQVNVPAGATQHHFVYLYLDEFTYDVTVFVELHDERRVPAAMPVSFLLSGLRIFNALERGFAPQPGERAMAVFEEEHRVTTRLVEMGMAQAARLDPNGAFDSWIGYTPFRVILVDDVDLSRLGAEQVAALRDWVTLGGMLVLAPGVDPAFFRSRLVRTFFRVGHEGSRTASTLPAVPAYAPPADEKVVIHDLSTDGRTWTELWRTGRRGFGHAVLLRTSLGFLAHLDAKDAKSTVARLTRETRSAPAVPGGVVTAGFRRLVKRRNRRMDEDIAVLETEAEVLSSFLRPVTELPSSALLGILFFLYIAVVGPANYALLRRKGYFGLMVVTVPFTAAVTILLVVLAGFAYKGRDVKGSRVTVTHLVPGQGRGARTSLVAFRTALSGERSVSLADGRFPILAGDKQGLPRVLDQTDGFEVQGLQTRQWDVTLFRSVDPVMEGRGIDVSLSPALRVTNRTGRTLGTGLFLQGPLLAEIPPLAPGESAECMPEVMDRLKDRTTWFAARPVFDRLHRFLGPALLPRQARHNAIVLLPYKPDEASAQVDGEPVDMVQDRAFFLLLIRGNWGPRERRSRD